MRPTRLIPALLAVSLMAAGLPVMAAEPPLPADPVKRLQALQNALINAAMDSQTRVRSAAWIDGSGKLHENTRITSDMKVRGVRVLSYNQDEGGLSANIVAAGKTPSRSDEACKTTEQKYRREATLETGLRIESNGTERYDWTMLLKQARGRLVAQTGASGKWLLTDPVRMPGSDYERQLTGVQPDRVPYQMVLELLPSGASGVEPVRPTRTPSQQYAQKAAEISRSMVDYFNDEAPRRAPMPFVIRLSVLERNSQRLLWQDAAPLFFPESAIRHTTQPLPSGLIVELDRVLHRWQDQLDTDFGCRPLQFNVVQENAQGWTINGGQTAGVQLGDQLLLLNREHLPGRILEPDSAQHMALVEVVSVKNGLATIRKLAGPSSMPKAGDWVATPF